MSDGKSDNDRMTGTYKFWHGLNEIFDKLILGDPTTDALTWDVQETPAMFIDPITLQAVATGEKYLVTQLPDDSWLKVSSSFGPSYRKFTNKELREVAQEVLSAVPGSTLVTSGSVRNRTQVFYSLRLPADKGGEIDVAGHRFLNSFSLLNSFDMSIPVIGTCSAFDTVCANTIDANVAVGMDSENLGATVAKHTNGLDVATLKEQFVASAQNNQVFAEEFELLGRWLVDEDDARMFFAGFVGSKRAALTTRSAGIIDRLFELYKRGPGSRSESLRDVFGAVTNYYTHESSGGDDRMKQWLSSEFGDAAEAKRRAFHVLNDMDTFCQHLTEGKDLWEGWLKGKRD